MATTATTSTHTSPTSTSETSVTTCTTKKPYLKLHSQPIKSKRRKCRETTISSAANPNFSDPSSVYLPRTLKISKPKPPPSGYSPKETDPVLDSPSPTVKIRFLSSGDLSKLMDFMPNSNHSPHHETTPPVASSFPSSFTKFNSALTAGLLNPMSPPPDKIRSSPTLFEMMASEPEMPLQQQQQPRVNSNGHSNRSFNNKTHVPVLDKQSLVMQRISYILGTKSPGNQFNDLSTSDVKLTLSSKDGISVSLCVHRHILVAHSRFFAVKLSDGWSNNKQQQKSNSFLPCVVEIADCDDVEVYIETLRLMYCKDLRRMLMKEDVCKVLGILKVSAAIGFDAGVLSCLEYLEAAPWAEDEEEKVASLLSELHLEGVGAGEVLKRVSVEVANGTEEGGDNDDVLVKLLHVVLEGKDEKARREMKGLVSKMLRENSSQNDLRKESLYSACDECLQLLRIHFLQAAAGDTEDSGQIARQADNLHWILDILIDRQIAEEFLKTWASQSELSNAHSKIPVVHRYEISRVTARLFIGIGKGQLLVSKDMRCLLLQTWLVPFYDDFGWMRRASKGLDRHLIEEGLSNTILTLPLSWQQEILLAWFDRFLNSGEDCPNIQRGFEVWWRRAFWRRSGEHERARSLKIMTFTSENS